MEQTEVVEVEELSKREKYRQRRGEEYEIVSKVAFLIGVSESHWKSQYTGLAQDIYEQLSENKNARIIVTSVVCVLKSSETSSDSQCSS